MWLIAADGAHAETPLGYLRTHGLRADAATPLLWATLVISIGLVLIVTALLMAGLLRRRASVPPTTIERPAGGLAWIIIGIGVSTVVLFGVTVWTMVSLAAAAKPPGASTFRLEVTGRQWWWEVRYIGENPSRGFITANEIHIPVGRPVDVTLRGGDVIHSFWVPALTGKTDTIPGQTNTTWLQAERAGIYRGQCTEYCGQQHAHMALEVIASAPDEFEAWWNDQLAGPAAALSQTAKADQELFIQKCGLCHAVRGTRAGGVLGPDLSHLMTRTTIAAGTLPNTRGHLAGWIAAPQQIKPGSLMPQLDLSGPELERINRYLASLK
jgi:cytochrome c oxidase subunit II